MTEPQALEAIAKRFVASWPTVSGDVPFAVENKTGELPTIPPATADQFAQLEVIMTTSDQLTSGEVGSRFMGRNGWIQVKLWSPGGEGTGRSDALAEAARQIFEATDIAGPNPSDEPVNTFTTSTQPGGMDGRWLVRLSRTSFTFYETK